MDESVKLHLFAFQLMLLLFGDLSTSFDINLATERAYTLSGYKQLVTSSTVGWVRVHDVQSGLVGKNSVVVRGDSAVCRVRDGDKLVAGRTDHSGLCLVDGVKKDKYQVLVDLAGLARLEWRHWDMFSNPEKGTVAYNEKTFVACIELEAEGSESTRKEMIGELDLNTGLNGDITVILPSGGKVVKQTKGKALVEVEPIKYQLEDVKLDLAREKKTNKFFKVGEVFLVQRMSDETNELNIGDISDGDADVWSERFSVVRFSYTSYNFWGHIMGTVKGLPARALMGNTSRKFRWGLEESAEVEEQRMVTAGLQMGTGLNISLVGELVRREVPYTATLVLVYRDGVVVRREGVSATYIHDSVENIREETDRQPFYLHSGKPAPTTTTTTTTTTTPRPSLASADHLLQERSHYVAPSPTSTLFPPLPQPVTKPNPLRQFYSESGDNWDSQMKGIESVSARLSDSVKANSMVLSGSEPSSRGSFGMKVTVLLIYKVIAGL